MKVQVLFFGVTAEIVGKREVEFLFEEKTKANEIFDKVLNDFPQMRRHSLLFAVNQAYSNGDEIIKNGDELAIFTAVSGG